MQRGSTTTISLSRYNFREYDIPRVRGYAKRTYSPMPICTVKYLHAGFMPATSTRNLLTLIPMSKSLTVMKSWWGIAKMRNAYKLLTCFLVRWLTVDLNYKEALLDGNSRVSQDHMPYCSLFLEDAGKNLLKKGSFVYTTFLDFRTDFSSRSQRLKKLYGRSSRDTKYAESDITGQHHGNGRPRGKTLLSPTDEWLRPRRRP